MASVITVLTVTGSVIFSPFLIFFFGIVFLACIGKSLGVRRAYINLLVKIFEYGRESIEKKRQWEKLEGNGDNETKNIVEIDKKDENNCENNKYSQIKNGDKPIKNGFATNGASVISRDDLILVPDPVQNYVGNNNLELTPEGKRSLSRRPSFETLKREFQLADCLDFVKTGVEAIIEDQVTSRFEAEQLKIHQTAWKAGSKYPKLNKDKRMIAAAVDRNKSLLGRQAFKSVSWNLLTRTNHHYEFISWRLTFIWIIGFFIRYFFLLPLRILICFFGVMWLTFCTAIVGYIPESPLKRWFNARVTVMCSRVLSSALSAVINYHNLENRPKQGICVANHTSPIDVNILMCDNSYALVGQRHGGFLGLCQRALARASPHIWFERSEVKDREAVAHRLKQHVSDPNNPPILIFPEGTCINNTSVMQFKKGSFEVNGVIYPVAIKYDPRFGDAFWNSSRYSMMHYLFMMMSSWAIVCDVWYLPPMYQEPGESSIDFANRVKRVIAKQGGLVDLMWDGQLKRMKPKKEWKEKQQEEFSKRFKVE